MVPSRKGHWPRRVLGPAVAGAAAPGVASRARQGAFAARCCFASTPLVGLCRNSARRHPARRWPETPLLDVRPKAARGRNPTRTSAAPRRHAARQALADRSSEALPRPLTARSRHRAEPAMARLVLAVLAAGLSLAAAAGLRSRQDPGTAIGPATWATTVGQAGPKFRSMPACKKVFPVPGHRAVAVRVDKEVSPRPRWPRDGRHLLEGRRLRQLEGVALSAVAAPRPAALSACKHLLCPDHRCLSPLAPIPRPRAGPLLLDGHLRRGVLFPHLRPARSADPP